MKKEIGRQVQKKKNNCMKNNKSEYGSTLCLFGDFPHSQLIIKGYTATSSNYITVSVLRLSLSFQTNNSCNTT